MSDVSENTKLLREILKWIRFAGMKEVKSALNTALDTEQKKTIYQLSDGERSTREIAKEAGVSDFTVRNYWKSWARTGIVEALKVGTGERYRRSFDLEDFEIEVSIVTGKTEEREVAAQQTLVVPAEQSLEER